MSTKDDNTSRTPVQPPRLVSHPAVSIETADGRSHGHLPEKVISPGQCFCPYSDNIAGWCIRHTDGGMGECRHGTVGEDINGDIVVLCEVLR